MHGNLEQTARWYVLIYSMGAEFSMVLKPLATAFQMSEATSRGQGGVLGVQIMENEFEYLPGRRGYGGH